MSKYLQKTANRQGERTSAPPGRWKPRAGAGAWGMSLWTKPDLSGGSFGDVSKNKQQHRKMFHLAIMSLELSL